MDIDLEAADGDHDEDDATTRCRLTVELPKGYPATVAPEISLDCNKIPSKNREGVLTALHEALPVDGECVTLRNIAQCSPPPPCVGVCDLLPHVVCLCVASCHSDSSTLPLSAVVCRCLRSPNPDNDIAAAPPHAHVRTYMSSFSGKAAH